MRLQTSFMEVRRLQRLVDEGQVEEAAQLLLTLPDTELASVLLDLDPRQIARLQPRLGRQRLADAVAQLDPTEAARIIGRFSRAIAADILEDMEPDDATDVVEELGQDEADEILGEMQQEDAAEIRELMTYPPETAGGRMTPDVVSIDAEITVAAAMRLIRAKAPDAATIYYIYVSDPADHLIGVVTLRDLVVADPQTRIKNVMRRQVLRVPASADQETAARLLIEHDLLALPVVDDRNRLLGVITADDVADVLEEEATEDIERLGGSEPLEAPYLSVGFLQIARKRIVWLLALFVAEAYTGTVLRHYEDTLSAVVSLTFFIPLLIGTGGNIGSQITTTLTRALATRDVRLRDVFRVVRKEMAIAALLGGAMSGATYLRAMMLGVEPTVQIVVALTAAFVVLWASLVAAVLPLGLKRIGIDPAVVSAPLITTLVDGTGLIIYFTVADKLLGL